MKGRKGKGEDRVGLHLDQPLAGEGRGKGNERRGKMKPCINFV